MSEPNVHGQALPVASGRTRPAPGTAPPQPAAPIHLRVVDRAALSPGRRRRRVRVLGAAAGAFVAAAVFALVWLHVVLAQNQFRLDRLNARAAIEQTQYERSRLQVDELESPQRIVATAEGKLGMVEPSSVTYLHPSTLHPSTVPGSPAAASSSPALPSTGRAPSDWTSVKPLLVPHP